LSPEKLQKVEALRKSFPQEVERSMIIPVLWLVQEEHGYVPEEAIPYIAALLPVPEILVREAVTWYSMFQMKKVGKYHLQVCHNLSCALRGADNLLAYLKSKLGIAPGETTRDGKFSLSTVECLASCGTAPVMQVNDRYYENLTKEKIDQLLAELK
jgi:NADH-quinone oxidoreductase E subunit